MKIVSIVGARPQFIKLAPLSKEIRKFHNEVIIHTGQHFDQEMSTLFFQDLKIPVPDYNLNISGGKHGEQTGRMLVGIEEILLNENPELVIIFGDTNSTLAGSLASSKLGIKTIHIEAGLRSFNRIMPEEINRVISDHSSDLLFAPTMTAMLNLKTEGLHNKAILTGDIMVDALELAQSILKKKQFKREPYNYYLLTLHRPYNVDDYDRLKKILYQLEKLDKEIIFPVHPRTREVIKKGKIKISKNIDMRKPCGYLEFINLQIGAEKIITDSGGIQKEAYLLKKPCITIRTETEWIETVNVGWNLLINFDNQKNYIKKITSFVPNKYHPDLFGKNVAKNMIKIINKYDF